MGQTLTAATAGIADVDGLTSPTYSYQWIRVDGADETNIGGATSATYTPVQDDVGKALKVRAGFAEKRTSAPTAAVTAGARHLPRSRLRRAAQDLDRGADAGGLYLQSGFLSWLRSFPRRWW